MPTTTISPQTRIVALIGVLVIAIAGSAVFVLRSHHAAPVTTPPPAVHHPKTSPPPVHATRPTVDPLLPAPLRAALEANRLVVAGFFNPQVAVDSSTMTEASAAAAAEHVGFVRVNLLDSSVAGPLTALLPANALLPNPGIVIYRRPGTIVYREDGFVEQAVIEQAVRDAK